MKTIEERAKYAGIVSQYKSDHLYDPKSVESGYMQGATEQKDIDKAILLKLKSVWEKEAQTNHDDELNYKQGYHDAVEKARKWFADYLMEIGYPDDWMRDSSNMESGKERFIKAMEG